MSGAVDGDVVRTLQGGRETLGDMLGAAQKHLQKVFIVFVVGLLATIIFLNRYGWNRMKADLLSQAPDAQVIAVTPFDVILLQVKIGLVIGVLMAIPVLIYYSRDALRARGYWPTGIPRWQIATVVFLAVVLLLLGATYGYVLFFPLAFEFLASNAVSADLEPTYSIVKWAQFVFLLSISFGLAAQLPLAMSGLALSNVVPYQTFRDYWKHAILGLYALGALFTPPDPLTQLLWATPLVMLYGFSLFVTRFLVTARAAGEQVGLKPTLRRRWNVVAGGGVVGGAVAFFLGRAATNGAFDSALASLDAIPYAGAYLDGRFPDSLATDTLLGVDATAVLAVAALFVGAFAALAALVYLMFKALDEVADLSGAAPASTGAPGDIDIGGLDAAGVRAAPIEPFVEMTENEALSLASGAMDEGDGDKAQAILDRFDAAQEMAADHPPEANEGDPAAEAKALAETGELPEDDADSAGTEEEAEEEESGNVFSRTGAGMLSAFTEDEVDEDDIGGYYYDLAFIASSLRSKAFVLVGTFMSVLAVTFYVLYTGGIGWLKAQFLTQLPDQVTAEQVRLVTLHPVEALVFGIKVATIAGAVATLPLLLFYAWPALKQRGFARGDRRVLLVWGGSLFATLIGGSLVGFLFVAPGIISWLANDAIAAHMVIAYRINNFGWLVFFTTVGVGIMACIPMSMLLFHAGGIVRYRTMRKRWRVVVLAVLSVIALLSPRGVFMMFVLGLPVVGMYGLGLAVLHAVTLGGRRGGGGPKVEPAD
ncbi:twin-arginine translocase subunit TatC [Halosegnis marinus]|uniref:Sec-independent protein translocase protein TatC n=1 Tax=Halosegnis marinus TaxID=3034023 RepID=A0ABD5ZNT7_9EURY|nr:twin-arginine translocase subunit TatC [Halosegnis sp. DT85]